MIGIMGSIEPPTRNEEVSVGTSSIVVSETRTGINNKRHTYIIRNISNDETDIITINIGYGQAVSNQGIVLRKNESIGESLTTDGLKVNDVWQGQISAICDTANGKLAVFERDI